MHPGIWKYTPKRGNESDRKARQEIEQISVVLSAYHLEIWLLCVMTEGIHADKLKLRRGAALSNVPCKHSGLFARVWGERNAPGAASRQASQHLQMIISFIQI